MKEEMFEKLCESLEQAIEHAKEEDLSDVEGNACIYDKQGEVAESV